jgi:hypothetical protein
MNYEQAQLNLVAEDNITATLDKIIAGLDSIQLKATIASVAFKSLDSASKQADKSLINVVINTGKTTTNLSNISKEAKTTTGALGKLGEAFAKLNTFSDKVIISGLLVKSIVQVKSAISGLNKELNFVNTSFERLALSGANVGNIQVFDQLKNAFSLDTESAKSFGQIALQKYNEYTSYLATVNTIAKGQFTKQIKEETPDIDVDKAELEARNRIQSFGKDLRRLVNTELKNTVTSNEALAASYEVLSAGFKVGADSSNVMTAGLKLAASSGAEAASVINLLSVTLNAYKLSSENAAEVAAKLNAIVENGITTVPQLTNGFGQLASVAVQAKVGLDDLGGALAVLTQKGTSTNVAMTDLQSLFATIISGDANENLRQYGVSLDTTAVSSKGLVKTLNDVFKAIGESPTRLRELIPDFSAYRAAVALTGKELQNFQQVVEDISTTAASKLEDVFKIRIDTDKIVQFSQIVNKFGETIIDIGEKLSDSGIFDKGLKIIDKYGDTISELAKNYGDIIVRTIEFNLQVQAFSNSLKILLGTVLSLTGSWITYRLVTMKFFKDVGIAAISMGKTIGESVPLVSSLGKAFYTTLSNLVPPQFKEALRTQIDGVKKFTAETKSLNDASYKNVNAFEKTKLVLGQLFGLESQQNFASRQRLDTEKKVEATVTNTKKGFMELFNTILFGTNSRIALENKATNSQISNLEKVKKATSTVTSNINNLWQAVWFKLNQNVNGVEQKTNVSLNKIGENAKGIITKLSDIGIGTLIERRVAKNKQIVDKLASKGDREPLSKEGLLQIRQEATEKINEQIANGNKLLGIQGLLLASTDALTKGFTGLAGILGKTLMGAIGLVGGALKFLLLTPVGLLVTTLATLTVGIIKHNKAWREANTFLKDVSKGQLELDSSLKNVQKGLVGLIDKAPLLKSSFQSLSTTIKDFSEGLKNIPYLLVGWIEDDKYKKPIEFLKAQLRSLENTVYSARLVSKQFVDNNTLTKGLEDRSLDLQETNKELVKTYRELWQEEERVRTAQVQGLKNTKQAREEELSKIDTQLKKWEEQGKTNTIRYTELASLAEGFRTNLSSVTMEYEKQLKILEQQKKANKEIFIALDNYIAKQRQEGEDSNNPFSNSIKKVIKNTKNEINTAAFTLKQAIENALDKNKGKPVTELTAKELAELDNINEKLNAKIVNYVSTLDSAIESGFISAKDAYNQLQTLINSDAAKFSDNLNVFQSLYSKDIEYMNAVFKEEVSMLEQRKELFSAMQQHRITTTTSSSKKILNIEQDQLNKSVEQAEKSLSRYQNIGGFTTEFIKQQENSLRIAQETLFNNYLKVNDQIAEINKQRIDKELDYLQTRFGTELTFVKQINQQIRELRRQQLQEDLKAAEKNLELVSNKTNKKLNGESDRVSSAKLQYEKLKEVNNNNIKQAENYIARLDQLNKDKSSKEYKEAMTSLNQLKENNTNLEEQYVTHLDKLKQLDKQEEQRRLASNEKIREAEKQKYIDKVNSLAMEEKLLLEDANKKEIALKEQKTLLSRNPSSESIKTNVLTASSEYDKALNKLTTFQSQAKTKLKVIETELVSNLEKLDKTLQVSAEYSIKELNNLSLQKISYTEKTLTDISNTSLEVQTKFNQSIKELNEGNINSFLESKDNYVKSLSELTDKEKEYILTNKDFLTKETDKLNKAITSGLDANKAEQYIDKFRKDKATLLKDNSKVINVVRDNLVNLEKVYNKQIEDSNKNFNNYKKRTEEFAAENIKTSNKFIKTYREIGKEIREIEKKQKEISSKEKGVTKDRTLEQLNFAKNQLIESRNNIVEEIKRLRDAANKEIANLDKKRASNIAEEKKKTIDAEIKKLESLKEIKQKSEKELDASIVKLQESLVENLLKVSDSSKDKAYKKAIELTKDNARRRVNEERKIVEEEAAKWNNEQLTRAAKEGLETTERFINQSVDKIQNRVKALQSQTKETIRIETEELENARREVAIAKAKLAQFDIEAIKAKAEDNKIFLEKRLATLQSYNESELTLTRENNEKIRELNQQLYDEDVKAAEESLNLVTEKYADFPEVIDNARQQAELANNRSTQNRYNNLIANLNDEIILIKDYSEKIAAELQLRVSKGETTSRKLLDTVSFYQEQALKKELESLLVRKEQIKANGGDLILIETDIAKKQQEIITKGLEKNRLLYEAYIGRIQSKANSLLQILDSNDTSFQSQSNILGRQLDLVRNIDDYNSRNIRKLVELETNENRRVKLAKELIEIQARSLEERLKIEREIFSIQVESKKLAMEKREIELQLAKDKATADLALVKSENEKILKNDKATKEEKELAILRIKASEAQLASIEKSLGLLPKEKELLQKEINIGKKQQTAQEQAKRDDLDIEKAKLTISERDDAKITNRLRKRVRQDRANKVTEEGLSTSSTLTTAKIIPLVDSYNSYKQPVINTEKVLERSIEKGIERIVNSPGKIIKTTNLELPKLEIIKPSTTLTEVPKLSRTDRIVPIDSKVSERNSASSKNISIEISPVITIKVEGKLEDKQMVDINKAINDNLLDLLEQTKLRLNNV